MEQGQVIQLLQQTLNPALVKQAEQQIEQLSRLPGFAQCLMTIVCSDNDMASRLLAATTLKNFVKKNWGPAPDVDVAPEEEQYLRDTIVAVLFSAGGGTVQEMISNALYCAAQRDFPEKWESLIPSLAEYLKTENWEQIKAALSSMDQIFKRFRYESKCTELWLVLKRCLLAVQEPLTILFNKMVSMAPQKDSFDAQTMSNWLSVLHLCVRCFHSLCAQDIPEYFEDHLKEWVEAFIVLMQLTCNEPDARDDQPTTLDELKFEICEVFTLYAQRYEEEINSFMQLIIQAVWQLVVQTGAQARYDTMVCAALEFLSIICQKFHYESIFVADGVLRTIANDVCVSNLRLRAEDLEQFENEPVEYMKRDLEATDAGTRRRGAVDLVRALCRRFEDKLVPILSEIIGSLRSNGDWQSADVVYCLVTAMASKTETAKSGATTTSQLVDVNDYYVGEVRGHLAADVNQTPVLKTDALRFIVIFRNQLKPEILVEAIQAVDRLLTSNLPILHKYCAHVIDKLLLVKHSSTNTTVLNSSNVPVASLLSSLVSAFDKDPEAQFSPYLIKAVLRVVAILDDSTIRHAGTIAGKLSNLVASAVTNPADSVHTHFLYETMCVLIKKTSILPDVSLDSALMPLIEMIFTRELSDQIPYALQITGVLLAAAATKGNAQQYSSFLNFLLADQLWTHSSNIPAALSVLEVYLRVCPESVFPTYSSTIMQFYARLIGSKALELHGFQLADAILPHVEKMQGIESPMSAVLNNIFQRIQRSKTPRFIKMFIVFIAKFAIIRGAEDLYKSLTAIQANMYQMVMERLVVPELDNLTRMTSPAEKRLISIGFGNILAELAPVSQSFYGDLSSGIVKIVEISTNDRVILTPEEEQAAMYNNDGEFVNPFCRLSYAPRPDVLAADVQDFKAYLAQAILVRGPSANPDVLRCVPEAIQNHLRTFVRA